jgi:hypothetical protein
MTKRKQHNMKTGLFLLFLLTALTASSQTKLIFHKSHSGSAMLFVNAAPGSSSGFGMYVQPTVKNAELDSVIFVNDTTAVMVTSEYCSRYSIENKKLWKAGRDTVYHHELFSQQHALNTIKETLMQQYYFEGDIDSTVFIGYDDNWQLEQQNGVTPADPNGQQRNELYLLLVFVCALLIFGLTGATLRKRTEVRE